MPALRESIQVWIVCLADQNIDCWRPVLAETEWERGMRFRQPADQKRFTVTRGILKTLLARYLDRATTDIEFVESPHGKYGVRGAPIEFNVSHSGDYALLAFAEDPVGVDVEQIKGDRVVEDLAARVLSPREHVRFLALANHDRQRAFFEIWTLKESVLKGIGSGLSVPPEFIDVAFYPDTPKLLESRTEQITDVSQWALRSIGVGDLGYAAAIAVRHPAPSLEIRHFESFKAG
jgi:4'-phosphopantetheinyl transferase